MTVAGVYSVSELRDLLAAKDAQMKALTDAFSPNSTTVAVKDPTWTADYAALQVRYGTAKAAAEKYLAGAKWNVLTPDSLNPAGSVYEHVLRALTQRPGMVQKGDLQDLSNRLVKLGIVPDYSGTPQPKPASDADERFLHVYDATKKAFEDEAKRELGLLRGLGDLAANPVPSPVKHPGWWLIGILGAVAGFFGLRAAVRTGKKYGPDAFKAFAAVNPELMPAMLAMERFQTKKEEPKKEENE